MSGQDALIGGTLLCMNGRRKSPRHDAPMRVGPR